MFVNLDYLPSDKHCVFIDIEGCSTSFNYNYDHYNEVFVRVSEEHECPMQVNLPVIVGSIAGIVFLVGLIILFIFRLVIWYKDTQEYKKFQLEVEKTKFSQVIRSLINYKNMIEIFYFIE